MTKTPGDHHNAPAMKIAAIIGGSTLLALAPVSVAIPTAFPLTTENWFQLTVVFIATLSFCLIFGLALIAFPFLSSGRSKLRAIIVILLISITIGWVAGGRQLATGPLETTGTIGEIAWSKKRDGFTYRPMNKQTSLQRPRKHDLVSIHSENGEVSTVKIVRADTDRLLAFRDQQGQQIPLRLVTLPCFKRLILIETDSR